MCLRRFSVLYFLQSVFPNQPHLETRSFMEQKRHLLCPGLQVSPYCVDMQSGVDFDVDVDVESLNRNQFWGVFCDSAQEKSAQRGIFPTRRSLSS